MCGLGKEDEEKSLERNRTVFIKSIGKLASEDWEKRHLFLPSLIVAVAIEGIDWTDKKKNIKPRELFPLQKAERIRVASFVQAVEQHNDYLATWTSLEQNTPNWERLIGETNYIRAVQYLQDAKYPYSDDKQFENKIVELIEDYGLIYLDE